METIIGSLVEILDILQEPLIGILTVYVMMGLKYVQQWIGKMNAVLQQMLVPLIAYGLTWLSSLLEVVVPLDLGLWTEPTTSAAISAGVAYAIHAGRKLRQEE